jgi:HhH-GPD superfamily base excision DNA repair protein
MSNNNSNNISRYFGGSVTAKRPRPTPECPTISKVVDEAKIPSSDVAVTNEQSPDLSPPVNRKKTKVEVIEIDFDGKESDCSVLSDKSPEITAHGKASSLQNNPFAKFAYAAAPTNDAPVVARSASKDQNKQKSWKIFSSFSSKPKSTLNKKQPALKSSSTDSAPKKDGFVRMKNLSKEEQERITRKWHSLADPTAPLEVRRYQVLLAARLHARCQEPTVRKAMEALQEAMPEGVTIQTMAAVDPEVLATHISNLQFYNVKAQQVVKAAQEIQTRFGGKVPEDEWSLSQITGIGKCFADLLAFVNTREKHNEKGKSK